MEAAGLALGAVSLLAAFRGAVDGYVLISDIKNSFEGAGFLVVKQRVEQERLKIWGDFYLNDHDECGRLQNESPNTQSLILYLLMEIELITTDINKLTVKYGLRLTDVDTAGDPALYKAAKAGSPFVKDLAIQQRREDKNFDRAHRWGKGIQWTVTDNSKFEKLVDRLEYLNDSLERVVPRSDSEMLALGLSSYILPSQNTIGPLSYIQQSGQQLLAACAAMKHVKLSRTLIAKVPDVKASELCNESVLSSSATQRSLATWTRPADGSLIDVVVEWKEINRVLSPNDRDQVFSRVKNLCSLLVRPNPRQFCLLPCVGLTSDQTYAKQHPGHKRLGYVFEYPHTGSDVPCALQEVIATAATTQEKDKKFAPLGDRFRLAQALASSVLLLHSAKWLHKNLNSENVLFFRSKKQASSNAVSVLEPYLVGFEFSRPDLLNEPSLERPVAKQGIKDEIDIYRHPEWINGFNRLSDIYSLGVLLFEIGLWRPIERYRDKTEELTRTKLIHNVPLLLPGSMGEVYSAVVLRCLTGDFGLGPNSNDLDKAFWSKVVKELDTCRA
ncbi:MAG: hypothetical protein M4579_002076 [Chaenotheca gracillima]|nr:MAG: hypothetical protein M4579_002076 [Chaenotheca gracillima]